MKRQRYSSSSSEDIPLITLSKNNYKYEVITEGALRKATKEQCEICLKLFKNKYTYLVHNANHIIIPLLNLQFHECTTCSRYFISQEDLNDHTNEYHPSNNVTNDNDINKYDKDVNDKNDNDNKDANDKVDDNKDINKEVKKCYISVRKNLFNFNQDDAHNDACTMNKELEAMNINRLLLGKVESLNNRFEELLVKRETNTENVDSIRNRIIFEDDAQALPSSIFNDMVDECKDAIDLIEPSWLINNLTNDSFECEDNKQNGGSDVYKPRDGVDDLQNDASLINHGAGILQNSADILQNSAGILQNSAGILQNSADILQSGGILNSGPNLVLNSTQVLQNAAILQQFPSILLDGSKVIKGVGVIQNAAGILQKSPILLQNGAFILRNSPSTLQCDPNIFLDGAGILENANLIQHGAGNLGINNDHIIEKTKCIDCKSNRSKCRLHGIDSQLVVKTQQNNTNKQKYAFGRPNIQNHQGIHQKRGVQGQRSRVGLQSRQNNFRQQQLVLQDYKSNLQGQQHRFQGHQNVLQGQQHGLQVRQNVLQDQEHSLKGHQIGLQGYHNVLQDHQYGLQGHQNVLQDQQHSLQGHENALQGQQHSLRDHKNVLQDHQYGLQGHQNALQDHQYGLQGYQNDLQGQQHSLQVYENVLQGQQHSLQGHQNVLQEQYGLQGYQNVLQGQQNSLQVHRNALQDHQYGLQGHQNGLLGLKIQPCSPQGRVNTRVYRNSKVKPKDGHVDTYTNPMHYSELIQSGIFKCTRCCKIYPNRLKLLKHEPSHIIFDSSRPDPCYYCEKYVLKEAMDRHCAVYHNGCPPVKCMSANKCKICGLNSYNWSLHYDLYHKSVKKDDGDVKKNKCLFLCELCFREMKAKFLEVKAIGYLEGVCMKCKKNPVSKRVYGWTKRPLSEVLKNIQRRLKNMSQMNKY